MSESGRITEERGLVQARLRAPKNRPDFAYILPSPGHADARRDADHLIQALRRKRELTPSAAPVLPGAAPILSLCPICGMVHEPGACP
jgi:hypothetical protein